MVGRSSVVLSQCWVSALFLLLSLSDTGDAIICNSCSFTYTGTGAGYECVNATDKVKTASTVSCEVCNDRVVYKKHGHVHFIVSSVSRSCLVGSPKTGAHCKESASEITCNYSCKTEKCNNEDLRYKEPAKKGGAMATFTHWTSAAMALMILLLNLIF